MRTNLEIGLRFPCRVSTTRGRSVGPSESNIRNSNIFEKNADMVGKSKTTFTANLNGLRVVPLNLFRTLRVRSVTTTDGQPLPFIQEDKNDDAQFSVILPKAIVAGEKFTVATEYEGKEAITNEGGGNYFPVARNNWYPSNPGASFGEYASYDMTFRVPKGMQIAATGVRVSENNEGGQNVTVWKSEAPKPSRDSASANSRWRKRNSTSPNIWCNPSPIRSHPAGCRDCNTMSMPMICRAWERTHRAQLWER